MGKSSWIKSISVLGPCRTAPPTVLRDPAGVEVGMRPSDSITEDDDAVKFCCPMIPVDAGRRIPAFMIESRLVDVSKRSDP